MSDCMCDLDGEWRCCIVVGGVPTVYGSCEDPDCGGICELEGDCDCVCHQRHDGPTDPEGRAA